MNKTTNYHLPQWAANDPVRREDFNGAMANIDAGLNAAAQPPYVIGSYTGNGGTQEIELGFLPSFLLINPKGTNTLVPTSVFTNSAVTGETAYKPTLLLTETGFQVLFYENLANSINTAGTAYMYIAFR